MTSLGDPQLTLALKSGNFGGPDFFLDAVEAALLSPEEPARLRPST
jgi:uncharacterized protein YgbK (DUF1537 family)